MQHPIRGLHQKDAEKKLKEYGFNELHKEAPLSAGKLFLRQFWNTMVVILLVAMVVSALIGEWLDTFAIGIIVLLNAGIGFLQEYKAEKAVEALKKLTPTLATVRRDGVEQKIPVRNIVPGDILILEEGNSIAADGTFLSGAELQIMEAALTGESIPLEKRPKDKLFMSTLVTRGHGEMLVTATGMKTQIGQIAHMVQEEKKEETPLQKDLNRLSKNLAKLVVILLAVLLVLGLIREQNRLEIILLVISLAVSVIPEGLPAVITLTLALGVERMAKQKAVIRRLSAAETLGSTNVICTDKTGTLTKNEMTVEKILVNGEFSIIQGNGYTPLPTFKITSKELEKMLIAVSLCNNAVLKKNGQKWEVQGDPTEAALLTFAEKASILKTQLEKKAPRKREWVFDSTRKIMSTLNANRLYSKGAPEEVLRHCKWIEEHGQKRALTEAEHTKIMEQAGQLASSAYRVLAVAYKVCLKHKDEEESDLIFLGLIGMMDPPRAEVAEAIETCKKAHIHVIMITGDHPTTARAIGEKIGLFEKNQSITTGEELDSMGHHELTRQLNTSTIFARVSPKHKVQILEALQKKGLVVAMTGDGVNDAPALKKADIGIAMGISGSDVAKEASDMVLLDDNFATIVKAIKEGRTIYRNIKKFIRFLLSANFDEILVATVAFLWGGPLPFLPLQILWINLLTDSLPAVALSLDRGENDLMQLPPRSRKANPWKDLMNFSLLAGLLSAGISLFFYFSHINTVSIPYLRSLLITTVVVFEMGLAFVVRFQDKHMFTQFFKNKYLFIGVILSIAFQFLALYTSPLQRILGTMALSALDWLLILTFCASAWLILEAWKFFQPKTETV